MIIKKYNNIEIKKVKKVLSSGLTNYWTGKENLNFEKEFSKYVGNVYSVAVSNGSVALEIALRSLKLKQGSEVIVTPRSFIISASCVANVGLKPIFADVDENGNLSIEGIVKSYNKNIKAIILVHLNGLPCNLDPIVSFAKKNKIFLIEDCSQAHGAKYKGRIVGSFGDLAVWSFCQDKIISTGGEGGMISTNIKKIWQYCWSYKDHGKNYRSALYKKNKSTYRWLHDYLGSNFRLTEMQAALGRYQLKYLDMQLKKRIKIANFYLTRLKKFWEKYNLLKKPNFRCLGCPIKEYKKCSLCRHAFYRINFFLNLKQKNYKKIISALMKKDIHCSIGSCPEIYREKIFQKLKFVPKQRLPNARILGKTSIAFHINPYKALSKINLEINFIKKILNNYL